MNIKIIGKTSVETHNMIWADIDGCEWGINEDFEIDSLVCDGTACDCVDPQSKARYQEVAEGISNAAKDAKKVEWV